MATINTFGIQQYYETHGSVDNPPVLLVSGLGGTGASWSHQTPRFSEKYYVVLPDQRGTGRSSRTSEGHTTAQLANDLAALVEQLAIGPVHVVGASTGGAIAQCLALAHPTLVRTLTLSSSFARFDAYTRREFEVRKKMAAEWDRFNLMSAYSLFLFGARYTRENPEQVQAWVNRATLQPEQPGDRSIALQRIDMICSHDARKLLPEITHPTLITCGTHNLCTPMPLSEELAREIPGAELVVFEEAGELIEIEQSEKFFDVLSTFIDRHSR